MHNESPMGDSGVNIPELLARVEHDRELLGELLEIFQEEFPVLRGQLSSAIDRSDMPEIKVAAHTLKGMLASLSFYTASACAMQIERIASRGETKGLPEELARLESAAHLAGRRLASVCQGVTD